MHQKGNHSGVVIVDLAHDALSYATFCFNLAASVISAFYIMIIIQFSKLFMIFMMMIRF